MTEGSLRASLSLVFTFPSLFFNDTVENFVVEVEGGKGGGKKENILYFLPSFLSLLVVFFEDLAHLNYESLSNVPPLFFYMYQFYLQNITIYVNIL